MILKKQNKNWVKVILRPQETRPQNFLARQRSRLKQKNPTKPTPNTAHAALEINETPACNFTPLRNIEIRQNHGRRVQFINTYTTERTFLTISYLQEHLKLNTRNTITSHTSLGRVVEGRSAGTSEVNTTVASKRLPNRSQRNVRQLNLELQKLNTVVSRCDVAIGELGTLTVNCSYVRKVEKQT